MATSAKRLLRYPIGTDLPDAPADLLRLVTDLESEVASLAQRQVLETGQVGNTRAGRSLAVADFTDMGLAAPAGIWNLSDLTDDSGGARALTNKGAVPFGVGIQGAASTAAVFAGSTAQALYIADIGAGDSLRIGAGSWGGWFRSANRGVTQNLMGKYNAGTRGYFLQLFNTNQVAAGLSIDGTTDISDVGRTDIADDRWHFLVAVWDNAVLRVYVDGVAEIALQALNSGAIVGTAAPFNIGGTAADGAVATTAPSFGRADAVFVTPDILDADHVRYLMGVRLPHGGNVPRRANLRITRRRKGPSLVTADFPTAPRRLHNFVAGALTDAGANNVALTSNPNTGVIAQVAGPNGLRGEAFAFSGAHLGLSSTDAGLPAALTPRSLGAWIKTNSTTGGVAMGWGTFSSGDTRWGIGSGGNLFFSSGVSSAVGPFVADGKWHQITVVEDNAAVDGLKRKLYLDGKLAVTSATLNSIVLAGANRFRVGTNPDASGSFTGIIARAWAHDAALTKEQVSALWVKSATAMPPSIKDPNVHIEAILATDVIILGDTLDVTDLVDLEVYR